MKKPILGKNLANLGLKELLSDINASANPSTVNAKTAVQKLPIEHLEPGKYQPRKSINQEALQELADSIRAQGLIQPIIVRMIKEKTYEIIAGERRWRAAQLAGLTEVPIILRELDDRAALAISLIENIQREDLNAIDEAEALQRLANEFNLTHQEIAETVGKSRTTVTNLLRLLELSAEIRDLVVRGELEMGHARALLTLPPLEQIKIAKTITSKKLSVRETERLIQNLRDKKPHEEAVQKFIDPNIKALERQISEKLGAKVQFLQSSKNKGKLVIYYNSLDELEGILEHVR